MSTPISPKVVIGAVVAIGAYGLLALLGYFQTPDGVAVLAHLPAPFVAVLKALIPPAAGAVAAYLKTDPLRLAGQAALESGQHGYGIDPSDNGEPVGGEGYGYSDETSEPQPKIADGEQVDYRPGA
ncbi:hypothetical protein [uncultured Friedmanniella sp.]|uniref:hypothetical protein n=1 Tax=uncultured Friedmanniella sp. TaxID=335381 RepID=UPI0035CA722E